MSTAAVWRRTLSRPADWYRKAAVQGDAGAQVNLGGMCMNGQGVPRDESQAVDWYRKAAAQGKRSAQHNLGVAYANGIGVPRDDGQAVAWFRRAADQGDADAQFNLGVTYMNGRGVPKDDAQAVTWFRRAPIREMPTLSTTSVRCTRPAAAWRGTTPRPSSGCKKLSIRDT